MVNDHDEKPKYFQFPVSFKTEEDRLEFKNYVHTRKTASGIPIHETAMEMLKLHKEKYKR